MTKMTQGIGFNMWDKIGPVWKLFLCLGLCYSVFIISFLSKEGSESQRLELTFMLGMFTS